MITRRGLARACIAISVCAPTHVVLAQVTVAAAAPRAEMWTGVTYLSGTSVYLEVGTKDGVRVGTKFDVVRAGAVIAHLTAEFVSSSRTACMKAEPDVVLALGDSVRFAPQPARNTDEGVRANVANGNATMHSQSHPGPSVRGRFGVRYLIMDPGAGSILTQPAFDVRLDAQRVATLPVALTVDVRSQRSSYGAQSPGVAAPAATSVTRVYQAALAFTPQGSPLRVTAGRQFATALTTMGMFDGLAVDIDRARVSFGALAGFEPDATSLGVSTDRREYGAYVQVHNRPASSPLWSLTFGGVGAYQLGNIDREFAYVRATFNSKRLSVFAAQEIDINRGWKSREENGARLTPTSTFVLANVTLSNAISLNAGVDNRRNVRLYRDYQNPETAFDDSFREGAWGGVALNALGHLRLTADARTSRGGSVGDANSYTASASVNRLTRLQGALHARATQFSGVASNGSLQSASVELRPFGSMRVEYTAGARVSSHPIDVTNATRMTWTQLDADIGISRSLYFMLSTSRETGNTSHTVLSYASLSYRF